MMSRYQTVGAQSRTLLVHEEKLLSTSKLGDNVLGSVRLSVRPSVNARTAKPFDI